jgi:3-oxoacyl-[acyl-carrier protein] reductase
MNDVILEVTRNPATRNIIKTLGLPIPLPEPLARAKGPWAAMPLQKANVVVGAGAGAELLSYVAASLSEAGATSFVDTKNGDFLKSFADMGEAFARPARQDSALDEKARVEALVFDASGIRTVAGLRALHDFFHTRIPRLSRSGRVVVLGRPHTEFTSVEAAAVQRGLSGFVRSVAKEIGRKGATANFVTVEKGAESRLAPTLRWILEKRSAFVSAQPFNVTNVAKDARKASFVRPLDGQVALVTGAARGIGRSTAKQLADEGAFVFVVDRPDDGEELSKVARELGGAPILLDVTAKDAVEKIKAALGNKGLDIIVHNAGVTRDKTLARMKPEQWDLVLAINLDAIVRITEGLESVLRDGGRVIALSSVGGIAGNVGQTNYAATKAGVIGWVEALSKKLASRGITANAIAPGFIETRMTAAIPLVIRQAGRILSALGQGGEPQDVGAAITFLASPGAQGITGQTLRVCGGALIGA